MTEPTDTNTQESSPLQDAAESEGIRRMFIALQGVLPFMPLLPIVLVIGLWGHVDTRLLLAWLAAAISVSVMRFYVVRAYLADASQSNARVWANRVAATSLWDGLIWGFAGVVFFIPDSVAHQVLIVAMVVGIPAGSVFVTAYWPRVQYGFAVPAVGMTAVKLISVGSAASVGLGVGMIAYIVILTRIMRRARAIALEATLLRFENLDLVEQLQEQKTAAENANVAKSQFLAAASHDLRQPLHALALYTDALSDRVTSGKDLEIVRSIQRCVSALEDLFQSLLDISRLDAGIVEPKIDHFELRPLVERLAGDFEAQAARNGVAFSAECPTLVVESDASLLERILLNLLSNAVRYTDSGSIRITARKEDGKVRISVIDTGPGIPAARHEDIFREFVQLQNPGRDRSKGLGLGLAIVRRLADLLGLQLDVQSAPGKGSTFSLAVRAGDSAKLPRTEDAALNVPRNRLEGKLIIVVEDEADVREGMRVLLEGWGCKVIACDNGVSVIDELASCGARPDVIIADYRLAGDTTGDRIIANVQEQFGPHIPGVIITGDSAPERLQEALASGYLLLHKPMQPGRLRALLNSLLAETADEAKAD